MLAINKHTDTVWQALSWVLKGDTEIYCQGISNAPGRQDIDKVKHEDPI